LVRTLEACDGVPSVVFSSSSCYGVDAGKRDRAQPGNKPTARTATADEPQTVFKAPIPG
jgi:hypothetical protein